MTGVQTCALPIYAHGILLAFVIYVFSEAINQFVGIQLLGLKKSPISTVMIAIILGLILGNIYNTSASRFLTIAEPFSLQQ